MRKYQKMSVNRRSRLTTQLQEYGGSLPDILKKTAISGDSPVEQILLQMPK